MQAVDGLCCLLWFGMSTSRRFNNERGCWPVANRRLVRPLIREVRVAEEPPV
jgi:hypothetical protein